MRFVGMLGYLVLAALAGDLRKPLAVVRQVGPNGAGGSEAAQAWKQLAAADAAQLPELLAGMDGATPLACNWVRSAVDEVIARARTEKKPLPVHELEAFVKDSRHHPRARRLAYEWLLEADPTVADRLLPTMLDDPSTELRRDAVARLLEQADKAFAGDKKTVALPLYRQGLSSSRDRDQLDRCAKKLKELGEPVDMPRHLGLLTNWKLVGPFANVGDKGVDTAYPPEAKADLTAAYEGKMAKVRWNDYGSKDEYGIIDLNKGIGQHLEAVGYAWTEFQSAREQDVEIRIGCFTVFKLWVNGKLVLERGDAYTGMRLDHYVAKARLNAGRNTILMKVCQAEPPAQLPKLWQFQLRICDADGVAILPTAR